MCESDHFVILQRRHNRPFRLVKIWEYEIDYYKKTSKNQRLPFNRRRPLRL